MAKPWDFNDSEKVAKAERLAREKRASLLIWSPMCTAFSSIQNLNRNKVPPEKMELLEYGARHLDWCMKVYRIQHGSGLCFVHEHSAGASGWGNRTVQDLFAEEGVIRVNGDMCRCGMTQEDFEGPGAVRKRTGFMTNSIEVAKSLDRSCRRDHRHIRLTSGKAQVAQVYPDELCKSILCGLCRRMKNYIRWKPGCGGTLDKVDETESIRGSGQGKYKNVQGKKKKTWTRTFFCLVFFFCLGHFLAGLGAHRLTDSRTHGDG